MWLALVLATSPCQVWKTEFHSTPYHPLVLPFCSFFFSVMFFEPLWAKGHINVPRPLYCQACPITCPQLPGFSSLCTSLVIARPLYSPGIGE